MDETLPLIPGSATATQPQFLAGTRFQALRFLGAGGMGVVYEVLDRERNCRVALKTLRQMSPTALYRFKQEFRSLSQISHPGLVQLHELISDGAEWFLTMELVEGGVDLMTYLSEPPIHPRDPFQGDPGTGASPPASHHSSWQAPGSEARTPLQSHHTSPPEPEVTTTASGPGPPAVVADSPALPVRDHARLRRTIARLAEAVFALHVHGKLHRDVKPSNALVTPEGRVVLLDFGLVAEVQRGPSPATAGEPPAGVKNDRRWQQGSTGTGTVVGTVKYMSPEQAAGNLLGEPSDWYAVGVILYRALTGLFPHQGDLLSVLQGKQCTPPQDPATLTPDAPPDLLALCRDLLRIAPEDRPTGPEILRRLGLAPADVLADVPAAAPFVGRAAHLTALRAAYSTTDSGGAAVVGVYGRSGAGKSTLVSRFLDEVAADPGVVILAGRCYEHESVPHKAVDSLIDALTGHLLRLAGRHEDPEPFLVPDLPLLARVFPVLLRLPWLSPRRGLSTPSLSALEDGRPAPRGIEG